MRYAMMELKFFFKDLVFVPGKIIRAALDTLGPKGRAEFFIICGDQLKKVALQEYAEGSKLREMLDDEISSIEKNARKKSEVEGRRLAIVDAVMQRIRTVISADRKILDQVVLSQCKELNLQPPDAVQATAVERAA